MHRFGYSEKHTWKNTRKAATTERRRTAQHTLKHTGRTAKTYRTETYRNSSEQGTRRLNGDLDWRLQHHMYITPIIEQSEVEKGTA